MPFRYVIEIRAYRDETNRKAREASNERTLQRVSRGESGFLSHMYQRGVESAAKQLMRVAGKPWPEPGPTPRKVKARALPVVPRARARKNE